MVVSNLQKYEEALRTVEYASIGEFVRYAILVKKEASGERTKAAETITCGYGEFTMLNLDTVSNEFVAVRNSNDMIWIHDEGSDKDLFWYIGADSLFARDMESGLRYNFNMELREFSYYSLKPLMLEMKYKLWQKLSDVFSGLR